MQLQKDITKSPAIRSFISGAMKGGDYFQENFKCLTSLLKQCEPTVSFNLKEANNKINPFKLLIPDLIRDGNLLKIRLLLLRF